MSTALSEQEERHLSKAPQGIIAVAATRAAQEVQAAMMIARQNPRDEIASFDRIKQACKRLSLAEKATYSYKRGTEQVTGPSIRLAEVLAQNWGNVDFGFTELECKGGISTVQAYCWDLETNVKQTRTFQVQHVRYSKAGGLTPLSDPRDIYEMVANQASRRVRVCILGIIPGDITESAVDECHATIAGGGGEPMVDRLRKCVTAFSKVDVSLAMLETRLQHPMSETTGTELANLQSIYNSIRENQGTVEEYFVSSESTPAKSDSVAAALAAKVEVDSARNPKKSGSATKRDSTVDHKAQLLSQIQNAKDQDAIDFALTTARDKYEGGSLTSADLQELQEAANRK